MAYSSEISRDNPVAFVFLIDQSYSMNDQSSGQDENGNPLSMAEAVADAINAILEELTNVAQRDDGVRDYFEIALIGYGGNETFLWEGNLKGQCFAKISDIKENADVETTTTEVMVRGKLMEEEHTKLSWLKPKAINKKKESIEKIEVVSRGRVRRSRLYYLRKRRGKAARIRERGLVR